eukprot:g1043.t1
MSSPSFGWTPPVGKQVGAKSLNRDDYSEEEECDDKGNQEQLRPLHMESEEEEEEEEEEENKTMTDAQYRAATQPFLKEMVESLMKAQPSNPSKFLAQYFLEKIVDQEKPFDPNFTELPNPEKGDETSLINELEEKFVTILKTADSHGIDVESLTDSIIRRNEKK